MKPKTIYFVLCFAGALLPYWQFVPWVMQNGLSVPTMLRELFAYRISAFFVTDVLVSAVVLIVFIRIEDGRTQSRGGQSSAGLIRMSRYSVSEQLQSAGGTCASRKSATRL
jgi:hypothetical protein